MKQFGYAGNILTIDLSDGTSNILDTAAYSDRFIGGRGIASKLYWDFVPPKAPALSPENCLICVTGPVAGFTGFAGSRWQICAKSPQGDREAFSYGNLGGKWGSNLKFAGFDGLVIKGRAEKPVYIVIENNNIEIKDASAYTGKTTFDTIDELKIKHGKKFSIITIGPAGENLVIWSNIISDDGSSASAGMGAVMASKNLKAVLVSGDSRPVAARPDKVKELRSRIRNIVRTAHFGLDAWSEGQNYRPQICFGCGIGCGRNIYKHTDGRKYKSLCQATMYYFKYIMQYNKGKLDNKTRFLGTRLCDGYGLDTSVIHGMIDWLFTCYSDGIITEKQTGLPLSKIGGPEFLEELTRIVTYREGFGDMLAKGTIETASSLGKDALSRIGCGVATRNSETKDYDPRIMPATALIYALEPRRPIQTLHEPVSYLFNWVAWAEKKENANFSSDQFRKFAKRIWGSETAADFTTMEGKALASKNARDRAYVKESMIFCDLSWMTIWQDYFTLHMDEPALESQVFSAVTGRDVDEEGINRLGERNVNMQRAVLLRQGWNGRNDDQIMDYYFTQPLKKGELFCDPECIIPGKDGEITSIEGRVFDRQDFEKLKDEYYELRGWDVETGLPRAETLKNFDMEDIARDLAERGLLK